MTIETFEVPGLSIANYRSWKITRTPARLILREEWILLYFVLGIITVVGTFVIWYGGFYFGDPVPLMIAWTAALYLQLGVIWLIFWSAMSLPPILEIAYDDRVIEIPRLSRTVPFDSIKTWAVRPLDGLSRRYVLDLRAEDESGRVTLYTVWKAEDQRHVFELASLLSSESRGDITQATQT